MSDLAKEFKVNLNLPGYRSDVPDLYHADDVCVFPSIREGLGMAAIEGMACGLPLTCSINRGTNEFISDGAIGCRYDSADDFAEAISNLAVKPVKRVEMGLINKEIVKRFDIGEVNQQML